MIGLIFFCLPFNIIGFNNAPQSSCIVIRNLPPTVTRSDVASRLLIGVVLVDVNVSAGPTANGRHTAIAHIKLESPLAAQQAIDQIVRSQDGSHLVVEISTNEEFNMAKMRTGAGPGRTNESDNAFKFANNLQQDTKTSIFDLESGLVRLKFNSLNTYQTSPLLLLRVMVCNYK